MPLVEYAGLNDCATPALPAITPRRQPHIGLLMLGGGVLVLAALCLWAWSPWQSVPDPVDQAIAAVAQQSAPTMAAARVSLETRREQARRFPRDGRAWALLAYSAFEADAYAEAAAAFETAATVSPKVAADPGVLCDWADALGMAQGGSALSSNYPKALEMAGSAAYERREFALAADYWRRLLPQMAQGSTDRNSLEDGIARAERLALTPPVKR
ncbi:MAG: hypothetical protein NTX31_17970 [Burkholderiales bacterium]|nr:hypothetical protein [Burkholderiales bacterium]